MLLIIPDAVRLIHQQEATAMERRDGDAACPFMVLTEIMERLKNITPDQYIAPKVKREPDARFITIVSEDIKRLFTLRTILVQECEEISVHEVKLMQEASKYVEMMGGVAIIKESQVPNSRYSKLKARIERADRRWHLKEKLLSIVNGILSLEVERQYPSLQGPVSIHVYADWSLCSKKTDETEEMIPPGLIVILDAATLEEIPAEVPPHNHLQ